MSIEHEIKKRRHFSLLASFERKIRDAYFASETDITSQPVNAELPSLFYRLTSLITDYQYADEKRKEEFANQISSLTAEKPEIRNCYKQINGKRQDLATFALEMNSPIWTAYMVNGEHTSAKKGRNIYDSINAHIEKDDDDYEPPFQKTHQQKALLFLMYASKTHAFLPDRDVVKMFTEELNVSAHQVVNVKIDNNTSWKTTPFMYFLQNHAYSDIDPIVPSSIKDRFYNDANFDFKNFEGKTLPETFISASLYNLFGDYYASHETPSAQPPKTVTPIAEKKEEDLFTWNVQKQEEKKTHLVQSTQPPQYKDTLFPLENLTDTQTKKIPSPIKPVVITHHKKDDMTPDLPGLEFERE